MLTQEEKDILLKEHELNPLAFKFLRDWVMEYKRSKGKKLKTSPFTRVFNRWRKSWDIETLSDTKWSAQKTVDALRKINPAWGELYSCSKTC